MIPMSIARVSHESSSRSNALLEPATGNPSYRPAIATGALTLVIPPRTSVTVTTTSSGLTLKAAGSILDDAAPSEDTRGIGAVMAVLVDGGDGPANAGRSTTARHISSPHFDARHAFRSLNHADRILVSRLRSMRTVETKSAVVHLHIFNRDSRFLCSRHLLEAARELATVRYQRSTPAVSSC